MEAPHQPFSILERGQLTFEPVDNKRFPAIEMAKAAVQKNASAPIIMNAANEVAVEAFLKGKIGFMEIIKFVSQSVDKYSFSCPSSLDEVIAMDEEVRKQNIAELSCAS